MTIEMLVSAELAVACAYNPHVVCVVVNAWTVDTSTYELLVGFVGAELTAPVLMAKLLLMVKWTTFPVAVGNIAYPCINHTPAGMVGKVPPMRVADTPTVVFVKEVDNLYPICVLLLGMVV